MHMWYRKSLVKVASLCATCILQRPSSCHAQCMLVELPDQPEEAGHDYVVTNHFLTQKHGAT